MKKIFFALLLVISVIAIANKTETGSKNFLTVHPMADSVYICNSSSAYAYHVTTDCRNLKRCTHTIIKVSLTDAVNKYRRSACKIYSAVEKLTRPSIGAIKAYF